MALDQTQLDTQGTPEWWMKTLAARMLDRNRLRRLAILDAYRAGRPPLVTATESQQRAYQAFTRVSRTNFARPVVRAPAERMAIRAIRTAAAGDDEGDSVAWRYFTSSGLDVASVDVNSDCLTFSEAYVRVGVDDDGKPVALRRDPWHCITAENPLNPNETIAGLEMLWDEYAGMIYVILSLPGEQWVAQEARANRPTLFPVPGVSSYDSKWKRSWFPRLSFNPGSLTMRPMATDVPEDENDGGLYSQAFDTKVVSMVKFENRDGLGEFEEHLDTIDCLNFLSMLLLVTAGIQAYKQRSLEQTADANGADRLPTKNPETGEAINWDEIFQPGPDALWKLPPGVTLKESGQVDLQGLISAITEKIKHLSAVTATPWALLSPDGVNVSAAGTADHQAGLVFKVEDRCTIAARSWAKVISLMFMFAPDEDRYDGENDRADAGAIVLDWKPAERYSLGEKSQADSQNKTLSADMAAQKIWGLTPDEVAINRAQRNQDALMGLVSTAAPSKAAASGSGGAAG